MNHWADQLIVVVYFLLSLLVSLYFYRRAGRDTQEFFLSGRRLPWWIAGTAMVATTFAADTPLAVTELVARKGVAGNWLWWNMVAGSVLTVFFFAKLWRRAGILTDVEFIELRYSGSPAAFLRGFRALYLGIFMNCVIMGWVNVALVDILTIVFGVSQVHVIYAVILCMLVVGIYSAVSGQWGVAVTDFFQFFLAMAGCIVLALIVINLPQVGGIGGLKKALPGHVFSFFPVLSMKPAQAVSGIMALSFSAFVAHILVQWWASWYPGAEPGGGGYVAQKMMAAKDERHSLLASLWFSIAMFALRPWPWILVALASLVLYPDLPAESKRAGYIMAMRDYLPPGLLGMMVAAFLAAYMSTISTHLNWGSSYIINDFYKRFMVRGAPERHYVTASRVSTLFLVLVSSLMIFIIQSISGAWAFIIECGAGLGLVLILRWFWWRINAWSEIAAMIVPFAGYGLNRFAFGLRFPESLFFIVALTTAAWVLATFLTPPTEEDTLRRFYLRVRPGGPGWEPVRGRCGADFPPDPLTRQAVNWLLGMGLVYLSLFSIGDIILARYGRGYLMAAGAVMLFIVINRRLKKEQYLGAEETGK
ncbi:MAG TPA: sodium:proline symporter [Spirochaetes bacterium]|nr:sodium:proline symporter [Spirochaetota bacterium]